MKSVVGLFALKYCLKVKSKHGFYHGICLSNGEKILAKPVRSAFELKCFKRRIPGMAEWVEYWALPAAFRVAVSGYVIVAYHGEPLSDIRSLLSPVEKRHVTYQLVNTVLRCHVKGQFHPTHLSLSTIQYNRVTIRLMAAGVVPNRHPEKMVRVLGKCLYELWSCEDLPPQVYEEDLEEVISCERVKKVIQICMFGGGGPNLDVMKCLEWEVKKMNF